MHAVPLNRAQRRSRTSSLRIAAAASAAAALGVSASGGTAVAATTWGQQMATAAADFANGNTIWMVILFGLAIVLGIGFVVGMYNLGRRNGNGNAGAVIAAGVACILCASLGGFIAMGSQTFTSEAPGVTGQAQVLQFQ